MEKVTGIGGFFFGARNSTALNDWYERHLGVRKCGQEYEDGSWWQDEGPTVFGAEPEGTTYGDPGKTWRINFRVRNLDAMIAQLRDAGITVNEETPYTPTAGLLTSPIRRETSSSSGRRAGQTPTGHRKNPEPALLQPPARAWTAHRPLRNTGAQ